MVSSRDTIVLFVHGAHLAGWCWLLVMDRLAASGIDSQAIDLPFERLRPMRSTVPTEPLADPAWASVPSSSVVCTDDRAVRPEAQRERAALVGAAVEIDTDHSPFFSSVDPLVTFIAARHRGMSAA
jgi:hypothetical protein